MTAFPPKISKASTEESAEAAEAKGVLTEGGVSEGFRRDLEAARSALAGLLQRLRPFRRAPTVHAPVGTVPSSDLVARLQLGLRKEHDLVLTPMLTRLDAFATRLNSGGDVPVPAIEEGLVLVDRYLHELHDVHLRLLQVAGADPEKGELAHLAFMQLGSDFEHARVRWATVRVMVRGYEEKLTASRAMLGLTLAQESRAERAWHDFEVEYARASIPAQFSPKVAEIWQGELDHARDAGRADRTRVEEWLGRTAQYATISA
ncbi:MAG: hypothetical protein L3K02_00075 [Thermoplasmata archaeon]|nr:hypothetical protein [Thermoplasmata archaeon]